MRCNLLAGLCGLLLLLGTAQAQHTTTRHIAGHAVDVVQPDGPVRGNLLVLPGWNFPRQDWCQKSRLCSLALAHGYRLILPEMGWSIYSMQYYPETRADFRAHPTLAWVLQQLIPALQRDSMLLPSQHNALMGLSTGARGVALIALHTGKLFAAGAALSGDYDQRALPADNLMRLVYGPYAQHADRRSLDNPTVDAGKIQVPLYLGHGLQDQVVPLQQTRLFYDALRQANPQLRVVLHEDAQAGHDYAYWDSEVVACLDFIQAAAR